MRTRALLASCLVVAGSCGDLPHTNPVDPRATVEIIVTASRQRLERYGDSVRFAAAVPGYPDAAVSWSFAYPGIPIVYRPEAIVAHGPRFDFVWTPDHQDIAT